MFAASVVRFNKQFKTDFVLVTQIPQPDATDARDDFSEERWKRKIYLDNLRKEGLKIETKKLDDSDLVFDLIYAPKKVIERYGEILKIKVPLKTSLCDAVKLSEKSEKDHSTDQMLAKDDHSSMLNILSRLFGKSSSVAEKCREIFNPDLPTLRNVNYAPYSRDRRDMFDLSHDSFFNQSKRIRCVEFLLKRKRFSEDPDDDFAFGVSKLIQKGVYTDAYPIHDGSTHEKGTID